MHCGRFPKDDLKGSQAGNANLEGSVHLVLPAQCPVWALPCQTGLDHRARGRGREQERNRGREREGAERERGSGERGRGRGGKRAMLWLEPKAWPRTPHTKDRDGGKGAAHLVLTH